MKVHKLTTSLVDRLVLVDRLYIENLGKLSDITVLVIITVEMAKGLNKTTKIEGGIKRIMRMAHLVLERAEIANKQWYVNNWIDLEIFDRIY